MLSLLKREFKHRIPKSSVLSANKSPPVPSSCSSVSSAVLDPQHIEREGVPAEAGEGWSHPRLDQRDLRCGMLMVLAQHHDGWTQHCGHLPPAPAPERETQGSVGRVPSREQQLSHNTAVSAEGQGFKWGSLTTTHCPSVGYWHIVSNWPLYLARPSCRLVYIHMDLVPCDGVQAALLRERLQAAEGRMKMLGLSIEPVPSLPLQVSFCSHLWM